MESRCLSVPDTILPDKCDVSAQYLATRVAWRNPCYPLAWRDLVPWDWLPSRPDRRVVVKSSQASPMHPALVCRGVARIGCQAGGMRAVRSAFQSANANSLSVISWN